MQIGIYVIVIWHLQKRFLELNADRNATNVKNNHFVESPLDPAHNLIFCMK